MPDLTDAQIEIILPRLMSAFVAAIRETGADPLEVAELFSDVLAGGIAQGFIRPLDEYSDKDKETHPFFADEVGAFQVIVTPTRADA